MNKYEHSFFIFAKILDLIPHTTNNTRVVYMMLNGKINEVEISNSLLSKCSIGDFIDVHLCINKSNELSVLDIKVYDQPLKLNLCSKCSQAFYKLDNHIIKRVDKNQTIKESCAICGFMHTGFEYLIFEGKEGS